MAESLCNLFLVIGVTSCILFSNLDADDLVSLSKLYSIISLTFSFSSLDLNLFLFFSGCLFCLGVSEGLCSDALTFCRFASLRSSGLFGFTSAVDVLGFT